MFPTVGATPAGRLPLPGGPICFRIASTAHRPAPGERRVRWIFAAVWLVAPVAALGQASSTSFQIMRQSIDGGAGRANGLTHVVDGTIGQPDVGLAMSSGSYTVRGGFHVGATGAPPPEPLFSDGFEPP